MRFSIRTSRKVDVFFVCKNKFVRTIHLIYFYLLTKPKGAAQAG